MRTNRTWLAALAMLAMSTAPRADPATRSPGPSAPRALAPDLALPPGTHRDGKGQLVSGRGLRDTADFFARELDRRGIAAQRIGPYIVRGVEITRFISQAQTPWLAIHVLRSGGKTLIFFVPRAKPAATP
jgi:hypothetical protein